MSINTSPIAETPISNVSISSPYMLFKCFEGTGTDLTCETNVADATPASPTTTCPITGGGGIEWSTKALAFTPDTTTDTYVKDPDFVADTTASPMESLLRLDDTFGTMLIAFTCQGDNDSAPTAAENVIGMGDNQVSSNGYMSIQQSTAGNMQMRIYNGTVLGDLDVADIPFASFTQSANNTFLFAVNKSSGNMHGFYSGGSSPVTTAITANYPLLVPKTAGRDTRLFGRSPSGSHIEAMNNEASVRILSFDNILILKSTTELTTAKLQTICDGLNEYKGDLPWALNGV